MGHTNAFTHSGLQSCRIKIIIQPKGSADFCFLKRKRRFKLIFAKLFFKIRKDYLA